MALTGMRRDTGRLVSGIDHLRQSITDILTTPLGSRRMRPEYGSRLPRMADQPVTAGWISAAQAECARVIGRWEPRLRLQQVTIAAVVDGRISLRLAGEYQGEALILELTA